MNAASWLPLVVELNRTAENEIFVGVQKIFFSELREDMEKFDDIELDSRLQQALRQNGFEEPTAIQAEAIPLALNEQRDIVARASTGSGKTLAYLIPVIQQLLVAGDDSSALILVPSKELAQQVFKSVNTLVAFCSKDVRCVNIAQSISDTVTSSLLVEKTRIIIGTPSGAVKFCQSGALAYKKLRYLVIDEADLVMSYGYQEDLQLLAEEYLKGLPLQTWLMSATLGEDVDMMKKLFCFRNIAVLKVESDSSSAQKKLQQFYVKCNELDKFLLAYVIFKLRLVKGKTIVFVNDIDRCYRLKMFLEQFGIKSCVLNSELPLASRIHVVDEFNKGIYNLLIATDENIQRDDDDDEEGQLEDGNTKDVTKENTESEISAPKSKKKSIRKKDGEYGVSRGVDFVNVSCVLNFDLPTSSKSYTHRIGRTARANQTGMALSFVVPLEDWGKHKASSLITAKRDEKVLKRIIKSQAKLENSIEPYAFDMNQVDSFRYRMEDAFRAVTKVAIREARIREIKQEILNSEKLKRHFEENPADLASLRHDKETHTARTQMHLKRIPEYLLPKGSATPTPTPLQVTFHKNKGKVHKNKKGGKGKRKDPLKTFRR